MRRSSPSTPAWPTTSPRADLIVTGEGRFDDQSLHGKVVSALAAGARRRGVPVLVLAGQVTLDAAALREAGITAAYAIADYAGSVQLAIDDAADQLTGLAGAARQLGLGTAESGIAAGQGTVDEVGMQSPPTSCHSRETQ